MAGAAELREEPQPTDAGSVVDSQLSVQGRGLEPEVVPVKLNDDAEGLVEVASGACLKVVAGGEVVVGAADGQSEAAADEEGVLGGAVGVGAAVVVVGTAVCATRRWLVGAAAEVEDFGVGHLVAADAAGVFEIIRGGKIERRGEACLETDGRQ